MTYGLLLVGNLAAWLIIAASIVVAFFIGGIEALGLVSDKFVIREPGGRSLTELGR
jgi:high-affinity nickel permease